MDCYYENWADWMSCNATCGDGYQMRTRVMHEELYGGQACDGETYEWRECNDGPCPGGLSEILDCTHFSQEKVYI